MSHEASLKNHPKELWILALTELCERYAFWGIGNLLVLFLIEYYQFSNSNASYIYGIFTGLAAFLPLLGGYLADRWNYQMPLFLGALSNATGCFLLASGSKILLYPALLVLAFGYGIFTPSILTVLGYTYREKPHLREAGFSIYYASINVGVFLSLLTMGTVAKLVSWNAAFFMAGIVQLLGLLPLSWYLYHHKETYQGLHLLQKTARKEKVSLTLQEKNRVQAIGIFCFFSLIFWTAYNQAFSSVEIFVHQFMDKTIGSVSIPEGVFLSSESFFLILLAPILALLYAKLQKHHKDPTPVTKTAWSLLFIAFAFVILTLVSHSIPPFASQANISSVPIIGVYFLIAVGEMLLAPIGLSMVSNLAPRRLTALLIGLWYVCVGLAFYVGGVFASKMEEFGSLSNFFSIFIFMTAIPGFVLFWIRRSVLRLMSS